MSTFNVTKLARHRVLIKGLDDDMVARQTVLDSTQWDSLQDLKVVDSAKAGVDAAVEALFAPVVTAIQEAEETIKANRTVDPAFIYQLSAGVDAVAGRAAEEVELNDASVILRLLAEGQEHRLTWVGDTIEVLAA